MPNRNEVIPMARYFTIKARIDGIDTDVGEMAAKDIQLELESRPYLRNTAVNWDAAHSAVVMTVDDVAESAEQARSQMEDELLDVGYAVLDEIKKVSMNILSVVESPGT